MLDTVAISGTGAGKHVGVAAVANSFSNTSGGGTAVGIQGTANYTGTGAGSSSTGVQGTSTSTTQPSAGGLFNSGITGAAGAAASSYGAECLATTTGTGTCAGVYGQGSRTSAGTVYGGDFLGIRHGTVAATDTAFGLRAGVSVTAPAVGVAAKLTGEVLINGPVLRHGEADQYVTQRGSAAMTFTTSPVTLQLGVAGAVCTFTAPADSVWLHVEVDITSMSWPGLTDYVSLGLYSSATDALVTPPFSFSAPGAQVNRPGNVHAHWMYHKATFGVITYTVRGYQEQGTGVDNIMPINPPLTGENQVSWSFLPL